MTFSISRRQEPAGTGIRPGGPHLLPAARVLAEQTGYPLVTTGVGRRFLLQVTDRGISLCCPGADQPDGEVRVDFTTPAWQRRLRWIGSEQLIRSLGKKIKPPATIIDVTGGLGRDGFLFAAAGFQVHILERNRLLVLLLEDGLRRAANDPRTAEIAARIRLTRGDSLEFLSREKETADVIYLDPMFPPKNTSAKVKKELQIIQHLPGTEDDPAQLFSLALKRAARRVIVKRPARGPWLNERKPEYSLAGKTIRFDIYLTGTRISSVFRT